MFPGTQLNAPVGIILRTRTVLQLPLVRRFPRSKDAVLGLGLRFRGHGRRQAHPFPQLAPAATTHFNPCANLSFGGDL